MAGRIKWSLQATEDLQEILLYWRSRNKSNRYGKKLNIEIKQIIKILNTNPYLGISTTDELIRVKIFKTYIIFYQFDSKTITILRIWDIRQDSIEIKKL